MYTHQQPNSNSEKSPTIPTPSPQASPPMTPPHKTTQTSTTTNTNYTTVDTLSTFHHQPSSSSDPNKEKIDAMLIARDLLRKSLNH